LVIDNGTDGIVYIQDFFAAEGAPIAAIELGSGEIAVDDASDTLDVATLLGAVDGGSAWLQDDDENYWDASIVTSAGDIIPPSQAQVFRTYLGGLGRLPGESGFEFWLGKVDEGAPLTSIAKGFVSAPEFVAKADSDGDGALSNSEFLTHMYVNVFQREPDNEGYLWWLGQLDDGHKNSDLVLVEMTQSNEYVELTLVAAADYLVA
jgi:hypothetical protein